MRDAYLDRSLNGSGDGSVRGEDAREMLQHKQRALHIGRRVAALQDRVSAQQGQ